MATTALCRQCRRRFQPWREEARVNHRYLLALWRTLSIIPDTISAITNKSNDYREEKIIGYTPEQVFDVVADVNSYKVFLPWCHESKYIRKGATNSVVRLSIGFPPLSETYTALVWTKPPFMLKNLSTDGRLFTYLESSWNMKPGPKYETGPSCLINFRVRFEFRSVVYARLGGLFFDEVARTMASSFEARCAELYGPDHLKEIKKRSRGYKDLNLIRNRQRTKTPPTYPQRGVHHEDL